MKKALIIAVTLWTMVVILTSCSGEEAHAAIPMDDNQVVKYTNKEGSFTYTDGAGAFTPTPDRVDTAEATRAHGISIYTLCHNKHMYTVTKTNNSVHSEHSFECSCVTDDTDKHK